MKAVLPQDVSLDTVDIWFQDESRIGQQGSQTRIWAETGTRPRLVKQQQFLYQYIFGAVCPVQKICAGIVVPSANQEGFQRHLEEISYHVPKNRHAVVVLDQAGWHKANQVNIPVNLSLLYLPPYSPELNPQEKVWQYLKDTYLANRVFNTLEDIMHACCEAWSQFAKLPDLIHSLTNRQWAHIN